MAVPYMKMYWGDYLQDTMGLSDALHGNYLLLIASYFCTGEPLPDNDELLAGIAKCPPEVWEKRRPILARYFQIGDGVWRHRRVDEEIIALGARTGRSSKGGLAKKQNLTASQDVVNYKLTNAISDVRCQMSDVRLQSQNHPPKPPANFQSVEWGSDDDLDKPTATALGEVSFRHGIGYDALAHAFRNGCTVKEIEAAVLQVKKSSKAPTSWGPYIVGVVTRERSKPPPVAPGAAPAMPKIKMTEAEIARMRAGRGET